MPAMAPGTQEHSSLLNKWMNKEILQRLEGNVGRMSRGTGRAMSGCTRGHAVAPFMAMVPVASRACVPGGTLCKDVTGVNVFRSGNSPNWLLSGPDAC